MDELAKIEANLMEMDELLIKQDITGTVKKVYETLAIVRALLESVKDALSEY